jgi:hypothetical protein
MKMSHEKAGERMVLNREYELNFGECRFGKEDGLPQWRTLLRPDKRQPHPFHRDNKNENDIYELGRPNFFFVVDDDQLSAPRNDRGLAVHRSQIATWKRRKVQLTNTGLADAQPLKFADDAMDSVRMILAEEHLTAEPLTYLQRQREALKAKLELEDLELKVGVDDYHGILMRRRMALREINMREAAEEGTDDMNEVVRQALIQPMKRNGGAG